MIMSNYSKKELLYNAAVESSDDAILTKTLDGIITGWNPAAERLYGYTQAEAVGQNIDIIVPKEMRKEIHSILERLRSGGRVVHHETVRVGKDGKLIHVSLTVSPVKLPSGELIGASAIARDITEKKLIEEALHQDKKMFSALADFSSELIWVTDTEGNYIDFLSLHFNFTGKTFEQREKAFYETVHPDDHKIITEFRQRVIENQKSAETEFRFWGQAGDWRWASIFAVPLTDENGLIHSWMGIKTDITRQKKLMTLTISQLHKSYEQLRNLAMRSNSTIENERQRIAIEVHDQLGGNLVEVKHNLESLIKDLKEQPDKAQTFSDLKRLNDAQELVLKTISAVKKISAELHPAELDYLGLVAAMKSEAENFSKRFGILLNFEFEIEDTSLDKEQELAVFRIFQEILRNVFRHAKATKINIHLSEDNHEFRLSVEDNGRGITEKEKRAEKSLGLLGMNERIQQVGGSFLIKGVEGLGTTTKISIPLKNTSKIK